MNQNSWKIYELLQSFKTLLLFQSSKQTNKKPPKNPNQANKQKELNTFKVQLSEAVSNSKFPSDN